MITVFWAVAAEALFQKVLKAWTKGQTMSHYCQLSEPKRNSEFRVSKYTGNKRTAFGRSETNWT